MTDVEIKLKKRGDDNLNIGDPIIERDGDLSFLPSSFAELSAAQEYVFKKRRELDVVVLEIKRLKLLKLSSEKEISNLDRYAPNEIETTAWCVAYNEELTGETKSIEVDYAVIRDPLTDQIRTDGIWLPGETEPPTDILRHPMAGSVHSTWFDVAIAPGAQAHKLPYRDWETDRKSTRLNSSHRL